MGDRNILETIERFWQARLAGDKEAVVGLFAPDATYEMVNAPPIADRTAVGPGPVAPAADRLIDDFQFHGVKQLSAIVDGRTAAVVSRLEVAFRGGTPISSEACDVWEFDASGKITSLRQFLDTDLVRRMIEGAR